MQFTEEGWLSSRVPALENFPACQMKCLTLPPSVPALRLVGRFRVHCLTGFNILRAAAVESWLNLCSASWEKERDTHHPSPLLRQISKPMIWSTPLPLHTLPPTSPPTAETDVSGHFNSWLQCIFKQAQRQIANERAVAATLLAPPAAQKNL